MKRENRSYFFQIEGGTCRTIRREIDVAVPLPKFLEPRTRILRKLGTAQGAKSNAKSPAATLKDLAPSTNRSFTRFTILRFHVSIPPRTSAGVVKEGQVQCMGTGA